MIGTAITLRVTDPTKHLILTSSTAPPRWLASSDCFGLYIPDYCCSAFGYCSSPYFIVVRLLFRQAAFVS